MNKRKLYSLRSKLGRKAKADCVNYGCDSCPFATCVVEIQTDSIESNTCHYFVTSVLPSDKILYNDYIEALSKEHPLKEVKGEVEVITKGCNRCHNVFIPNSNRQKYCKSCADSVARKRWRESKASARLDVQR